eukprot:gene8948-9124_t
MLPVAALYSSTGQVLAAALRARGCSVPNSGFECCKQLGLHLGPSCKFFCGSCNRQLPSRDSLTADGSDAGVSQPAVAAARVAVQLWQQLVMLEGEMVADKNASHGDSLVGSAGRGAGRSRGGGSSSKASRPSKASTGWASGTGYGGAGNEAAVKSAMAAAACRQKASDAAVLRCLNNITLLASGRSPLPPAQQAAAAVATPTEGAAAASTPSRKRRRHSINQAGADGQGSPGSGMLPAGPASSIAAAGRALGVAGVAVFLGGPLAWLLRLLFQNDSLLDIGGRQELYQAGMTLIR